MDYLETKMDYLETKIYLVIKMASLRNPYSSDSYFYLYFFRATPGVSAIPTIEIEAAQQGLGEVLTDEENLANGLRTVAKARALWPKGCIAPNADVSPEVARFDADCM